MGLAAGSLANWAIYRWAWNSRPISPWSDLPEPTLPRRWTDRIPVLGWIGLRRESKLWGPGFWIRPMVLELLAGGGLAWLYWWEVCGTRLLPPSESGPAACPQLLHMQFLAHALLCWLMLVASMIDLDERLIPDTITVPGTLLGLLLAVGYPAVFPRVVDIQLVESAEASFGRGDIRWHPGPLQLSSPYWAGQWPGWLRPYPQLGGLGVAFTCWWLWCVGLMPRTWYTRHGIWRAIVLCWARLWRHPATYRILVVGAAGSLAIGTVWFWAGQGPWLDQPEGAQPTSPAFRWVSLLSSLVGLAGAGLLVWLVRIIATNVLRKEAMGFGDVTLLAMIGAFLGWQPCLIIFLLAPFFGLIFGLFRFLLHSEQEIPYGPFLCLATLLVLIHWQSVWTKAQSYFLLGWWIPTIVALCLALLAGMLMLIQKGKQLLLGRPR
ncbi:MAG: A24 family peptidase [Thermoguttaceae bacterium]|nr:A24 family peptidase [Thermoguttaceae bacterium]MDW8037823.1 A24 family peptidase [Thermoguttaceae bacterium]